MNLEDGAGRCQENRDVGKQLCVCYVLETKKWAEFPYLSCHTLGKSWIQSYTQYYALNCTYVSTCDLCALGRVLFVVCCLWPVN